MSDEKFTPGEWTYKSFHQLKKLAAGVVAVDDKAPMNHVIKAEFRSGPKNLRTHVFIAELNTTYGHEAETVANGHMLGSAKELFNAVIPLAACDSETPPGEVDATAWRDAVLDARAALGKARGETP